MFKLRLTPLLRTQMTNYHRFPSRDRGSTRFSPYNNTPACHRSQISSPGDLKIRMSLTSSEHERKRVREREKRETGLVSGRSATYRHSFGIGKPIARSSSVIQNAKWLNQFSSFHSDRPHYAARSHRTHLLTTP